MSLSSLNTTPQYTTQIPSTKQKVTYRPYLVKEEKVLMMAMETQDPEQVLRAVVNTLKACINEDIPTQLTTFDVEYLFLQVRSKSVGETSTVGIKCTQCSHSNEVTIALNEIKIDVPKVNNIIQLTDKIGLKMKWPTYDDMASVIARGNSTTETTFDMVARCIEAVDADGEYILVKDEPPAAVQQFIESLTTTQFTKIRQWIDDAPKLQHAVKFSCEKCGHDNEVTLEGLNDFF